MKDKKLRRSYQMNINHYLGFIFIFIFYFYFLFLFFINFLNNYKSQTILLVSNVSKLFRKVTTRVC